MKKVENDLTSGSVFQKLWWFTLPFIGTNLVQTLYSMVDLYIVGQFATTADVSAVSVSGIVISTFTLGLIGLSVGATVVIGQRFGAGEKDSLGRVSATAFTLFGIIGIAIGIILALLAKPLLLLINTPEEAMPGALAYMLICCIGFIFQAEYNTLSGILRGVGDSKSPLLFVTVSSILNVIGDLILVWGFHMGAAGAAIATVAAQAICMFYGMIHVKRRGFPFDFKPSSFRIHLEDAKELLHMGLPISAQELLVMFSFIVIEGIVNKQGLNSSAAAGILDKIFIFATIPTNSFYASISAMVAQNIGAGEEKRCKQCLKYGVILSECFALFFLAIGLFFPAQAVGIFTKDAGVISEGVAYFAGYKYEYIFCALAFCVNGFINGTGHTKLTLVTNIVSTYLVRLPGFLIISSLLGGGLYELGWALPVASVIQGIIGYGFYFTGKWKKKVVKV